ncbi:MAG: transglutaminase, partial [Streptosporangiales bacterium]
MSRRLTVAAAVATTAASLSLYPVVNGGAWIWDGIGAVAVAAGAGTLTRLRTLPVFWCATAGLAALLLYLNAMFAGAYSLGRIVPTGSSLA